MKSLFAYYLAIILPMLFLSLGAVFDHLDAYTFSTLLLLYALVYHPLVSGLRLLNANRIDRNAFWRMFIPFWSIVYYSKYAEYLYFNK